MRRFTLTLLALGLTLGTLFAQTPLNDGNKAMQAKNYPEAIKQYETYFGGDKAKMKGDTQTLFNLSYAYLKNKDYDKAMNGFDVCAANNYKADNSTYMKGIALKGKGDINGFISTMTKGMDTYPNAKKNFQTALSKHYNATAAVSFNEANKIATDAAQNPATYVANMNKALKKYDTAEAGFKKTLTVDSNNAVATGGLKKIADTRKTFDEYKASLKK